MNQYKVSITTAKRFVDSNPTTVRLVIYPDGRETMQGAYQWSQGFDGGLEWHDMPRVKVDKDGREMIHA